MTQEDKELLLKDLCARLPYGVKCYYNSPEIDDDVPEGISVIKGFQNEGILVEIESGDVIDIDYVKPYLRPMSSMTDKEFNEYMQFIKHSWEGIDKEEDDYYVKVKDRDVYTDWLLAHHFDYRGLIEKGLALEAPEGMYK